MSTPNMMKEETARYITSLKQEIEELMEGTCRYNCRTAKANYMRGWLDALKHVDSAIGWKPKEREGGWNENRASS